jgi:hypothetical protein
VRSDNAKQLRKLNGRLKKTDSFTDHNFRVVAMETRVKKLSGTAEKREHIDCDVSKCKLDLERANRELARANTALFVLARSTDKKRNELKEKIANYIRSKSSSNG